MIRAFKALGDYVGREPTHTTSIEAGGLNSTTPFVVAAQLGIPLVDADGMGRAFPEIQMDRRNDARRLGTPMTLADEKGNSAVIDTIDNLDGAARADAVDVGAPPMIALYPMDGAQPKAGAPAGDDQPRRRARQRLRETRAAHGDPFDALIEFLAGTLYRHARVIFEGKVTDVSRANVGGLRLRDCGHRGRPRRLLEVVFQNEHLVARIDGEVAAIVPDLICVLDADRPSRSQPRRIRYGQRVKVMAVSRLR